MDKLSGPLPPPEIRETSFSDGIIILFEPFPLRPDPELDPLPFLDSDEDSVEGRRRTRLGMELEEELPPPEVVGEDRRGGADGVSKSTGVTSAFFVLVSRPSAGKKKG